MVRAANSLASVKTVAAYGELFNSAYWASRPYRGTEMHLSDACEALAEYLIKDDRTGVFRRLASRLRVDALKLHRLLSLLPDETPRPGREHVRRSIGVLQAHSVEFSPVLPSHFAAAVGRIGFGNSTKLIVWMKEPIEDFGMLDAAGSFGHFWPRLFGEESVIVGYSGAERADALAGMGEEAAINEGLTELAGAFGAGFRNNVAAARHFTWSDDPLALGSYSYSPIDIGTARADIRTPIESTLYYAGEAANAHGHTATVHGAIESGRDVAALILSGN